MSAPVEQPAAADSVRPILESFSAFCRGFRTRLKERRVHPRAFAIWPGCIAMERASRDELLALQQSRLRELLAYVVEHVPFYRRWARESGHRAGDAIRLEDLPIVTKADYRRELESFISDAFPRSDIAFDRTSGSTGEPLRFGSLRAEHDESYCVQWRGLARFGLRPGTVAC